MEEKKTLMFMSSTRSDSSELEMGIARIYSEIIVRIANGKGYLPCRLREQELVNKIADADIVIADLTGMDSVGFYTLGIRKALRGKCIYIIDNRCEVISDKQFSPMYKYNLYGDADEWNAFSAFIEQEIEFQERQDNSNFLISPDEICDRYHVTLLKKHVKGTKEHYILADQMMKNPCRRIFLMQRSSSIVLGDEDGWQEEAYFLQNILAAIKSCTGFYHIITLEGIEAHLCRRDSIFSKFGDYSERLTNSNGYAAVKGSVNGNRSFFLKKLPKDRANGDFKLDRQARILIAEYMDGMVETILVQNLGEQQLCFLLRGRELLGYMNDCIQYYDSLRCVSWKEIEDLYEMYKSMHGLTEESEHILK